MGAPAMIQNDIHNHLDSYMVEIFKLNYFVICS
jgi:hypothetical protein